MVRTTASVKPTSAKPIEQFQTQKHPEITRLEETDPIPPPPPGKSGCGSGKDGRPTVTDLIKARESEAALRDTTQALRNAASDSLAFRS
jgi:hypothetical protein